MLLHPAIDVVIFLLIILFILGLQFRIIVAIFHCVPVFEYLILSTAIFCSLPIDYELKRAIYKWPGKTLYVHIYPIQQHTVKGRIQRGGGVLGVRTPLFGHFVKRAKTLHVCP